MIVVIIVIVVIFVAAVVFVVVVVVVSFGVIDVLDLKVDGTVVVATAFAIISVVIRLHL